MESIRIDILTQTQKIVNQIDERVKSFGIFEHIWKEKCFEDNDKVIESPWLKDQVINLIYS